MLPPPSPPPPPDGPTIDSAARQIGVSGQRLRAMLYAAYSAARIGDTPIWPQGLAGTHADVVKLIRFVNDLAVHANSVRHSSAQKPRDALGRRQTRLGTAHRNR
ncbi:MAG: hypothetical protein GC202_03165 [Alphaproteobacteria bacterium]|nr:hypothetical protein [Alphaproteobacteria bacterium]